MCLYCQSKNCCDSKYYNFNLTKEENDELDLINEVITDHMAHDILGVDKQQCLFEQSANVDLHNVGHSNGDCFTVRQQLNNPLHLKSILVSKSLPKMLKVLKQVKVCRKVGVGSKFTYMHYGAKHRIFQKALVATELNVKKPIKVKKQLNLKVTQVHQMNPFASDTSNSPQLLNGSTSYSAGLIYQSNNGWQTFNPVIDPQRSKFVNYNDQTESINNNVPNENNRIQTQSYSQSLTQLNGTIQSNVDEQSFEEDNPQQNDLPKQFEKY